MGVSENSGTPQIIHFNRVFQYKPSILGYPYFWKHPYTLYNGDFSGYKESSDFFLSRSTCGLWKKGEFLPIDSLVNHHLSPPIWEHICLGTFKKHLMQV